MSFDFDEIAEDAVEEVFGFRRGGGGGKGRPLRRVIRNATRRRKAARERQRAGWGSAAWQAQQAAGEDYSDPYSMSEFEEGGIGLDFDLGPEEEEADAILAEDDQYDEYDEYDDGGMDEYGEDELLSEEEYGRRGGRGRRRMRRRMRPIRRMMRRMRNRRQRRRSGGGSSGVQAPSVSAVPYASALSPAVLSSDDFDGYEEPWESKTPGVSSGVPSPGYGYDRADQRNLLYAEETYGSMLPEPRQDGTLGSSFTTGVGLGLGFAVVAIGMNVLSKALR